MFNAREIPPTAPPAIVQSYKRPSELTLSEKFCNIVTELDFINKKIYKLAPSMICILDNSSENWDPEGLASIILEQTLNKLIDRERQLKYELANICL